MAALFAELSAGRFAIAADIDRWVRSAKQKAGGDKLDRGKNRLLRIRDLQLKPQTHVAGAGSPMAAPVPDLDTGQGVFLVLDPRSLVTSSRDGSVTASRPGGHLNGRAMALPSRPGDQHILGGFSEFWSATGRIAQKVEQAKSMECFRCEATCIPRNMVSRKFEEDIFNTTKVDVESCPFDPASHHQLEKHLSRLNCSQRLFFKFAGSGKHLLKTISKFGLSYITKLLTCLRALPAPDACTNRTEPP
jgi:hypothetical protein